MVIPPSAVFRSNRGAVMVFVLLLMVMVGMLTASWLTLMSARSGMVQQMEAAIQRRVAYENSKFMAQQFMLERVMVSSSGDAFSYNFPAEGWGGITVPSWSHSALNSFDKAAGYNHFNPGNGNGYTNSPMFVTLRDGDADPTRRYSVKSRSPLLSGTLLSSQKPTLSPGSSLSISGLSVSEHSKIWTPSLSMSFRTSSYSLGPNAPVMSFLNSSGNSIAPLNFARPREISNPRTGSSPVYYGEFDAIHNNHSAANSLAAKAMTDGMVIDGSIASSSNGVQSDGNGTVTINLATLGLGNIYIPGHISTLNLVGQDSSNDAAADDLPAILVVVNQDASSTRSLNTVNLSKNNSRRLILAIKKSNSVSSLPFVFSSFSPSWRLLLEIENTPIALYATGTIRLRGGIRTDRSISVPFGSVTLSWESDPKYLERLSSRTAWVESFAP